MGRQRSDRGKNRPAPHTARRGSSGMRWKRKRWGYRRCSRALFKISSEKAKFSSVEVDIFGQKRGQRQTFFNQVIPHGLAFRESIRPTRRW